jgi:hypothetical protein
MGFPVHNISVHAHLEFLLTPFRMAEAGKDRPIDPIVELPLDCWDHVLEQLYSSVAGPRKFVALCPRRRRQFVPRPFVSYAQMLHMA